MNKLDLVVFGATGFSGKYVAKMLATIDRGVKWGVAGRSVEKMETLSAMLEELGDKTSKNHETFICDANDKRSLLEVCKRTKLIINCVGPYTKTGYTVVEACIEAGTHYMDITVELNYILDLSRKYHQLAQETNVLIVPACGLSAIGSNMGLLYLEEQFSGTLKYVELHADMILPKEALYPNSKNAMMHSASLNTTMERMTNKTECKKLANEMLPCIEEPADLKRWPVHYHNGKVWAPFTFPDEPIANLSQKYLNVVESKRYIPVKMYISTSFSLFFLICIPFVLIFYVLLVNFEWFRSLVRKYPGWLTCGYITHEGPIDEVRKKFKCCLTYEGKGWSKDVKDFSLPANKTMKLQMTAYDAYQATASAAVASALTILEESSKMPRGGVVNCWAAFRGTDIVRRLQDFDIKYEIIEE